MSRSQVVLVAVLFSAVAAATGAILGQQMSGPAARPAKAAPAATPPVAIMPQPDCTACRATPGYLPVSESIPLNLSWPCQCCYVNDLNAAGLFTFRVEYSQATQFWGYHDGTGRWVEYHSFR